MASKRLQSGVVFLLVILNISITQCERTSNLLSRLMGSKTKPVVLVLDRKTSHLKALSQNDAGEEPVHSIEYSSEMPDDDHHAYLLYKLLKTIEDDDELDESVELEFDSTKKALRQGPLRARCQMLILCIEECPRKKPKCPKKCEQKYDDWGACGEKMKKKKKPKCDDDDDDECGSPKCRTCGKTMPPKWLLI